MKPARNQWPVSAKARMVMFAAQAAREMLDFSNFESFRVQTLDLTSRLREVAQVCQDIEAHRVPAGVLQPVIAELCWSLKNDPVAKLIDPSGVAHFCSSLEQKQSFKQADTKTIERLAKVLFLRIMPKYQEYLLKCYNSLAYDEKRASDIHKLIQVYMSHLINMDYDRSFLLVRVEDIFFKPHHARVGKSKFGGFLSSFDRTYYNYQIWIPTNRSTALIVKRLELMSFKIVETIDLPPDAIQAFNLHSTLSPDDSYVYYEKRHIDENSVFEFARELLSRISGISFLHKEGLDLRLGNHAYVRAKRSRSGRHVTSDGFALQATRQTVSSSSVKRINKQLRSIIDNFSESSSRRILDAINTVSLARSSVNPENQIISLWSSVEVLLGDPPADDSRISHYLNYIVPAICLTYPRRYVCAVYEQISRYHRSAIRSAFKNAKFEKGGDEHLKFAQLCFNPNYENSRKLLLSRIQRNPLAEFRFWKMYNNFSNNKSPLHAITSHEDRVRWQLNRIYRARNNLVHSGNKPPYLEPLVMNCFEYFKTAFVTISKKSGRFDEKIDIEDVVTDVIYDYSALKSSLLGRDNHFLSEEKVNSLFSSINDT